MNTRTRSAFRDFFKAYLECALWSSNDNADARGGEPLDAKLGRALTDAAHAWGSCDLYVGDDGKVYAS